MKLTQMWKSKACEPSASGDAETVLGSELDDSMTDPNENKVKSLRIHMKANGDDSELEESLSPPAVVKKFDGGFGFFVN